MSSANSVIQNKSVLQHLSGAHQENTDDVNRKAVEINWRKLIKLYRDFPPDNNTDTTERWVIQIISKMR